MSAVVPRISSALGLACALWLTLASCGPQRCEEGAACREADAPSARDGAVSLADARDDAGRAATRTPRVVQVDKACAVQSVRAKRGLRPVDAIFVIDNSGSMSEEIAAVRDSINDDFATIIDERGVDLRIILITRFGSAGTDVCIEPPLGGAPCSSGIEASSSARFFHYDQEIGSYDALCHLLATFDQADAVNRAPDGWQAWLRPQSTKAFVVVSDDSARCAYREGGRELKFGGGTTPHEDALLFHKTLLAKSALQFGAPPDTRYRFYSIVGLASAGAPGAPLLPHEPLREAMCDTAIAPGLPYQALSIVSDGLRYPVCEGRSFDEVFRVLARSVVESSSADCAFELPAQSSSGEAIDRGTVSLEFRAQSGGDAQFVQVPSRAACKDELAFYIDERVELCPSACELVKRDSAPEVELRYGCEIFVQ
jgi:hypothetical protein